MLGLRLRFLKVVLLTCRADGCGTEGSQERMRNERQSQLRQTLL